MAKLAGIREQRHQPRYDVLVRDDGTVAVQARTILFGGTNVGTIAKTNMQIAGALPSDNTLVILALRTYISLEDVTLYQQVDRGLYFQLDVAEKPQIQGPVWYLPAGGGLFGYSSVASTSFITNGLPSHEAILKLAKPILLPARQQFDWVFDFYTLGTEDARSSLNADTSSKVIMAMIDGVETRDVL